MWHFLSSPSPFYVRLQIKEIHNWVTTTTLIQTVTIMIDVWQSLSSPTSTTGCITIDTSEGVVDYCNVWWTGSFSWHSLGCHFSFVYYDIYSITESYTIIRNNTMGDLRREKGIRDERFMSGRCDCVCVTLWECHRRWHSLLIDVKLRLIRRVRRDVSRVFIHYDRQNEN